MFGLRDKFSTETTASAYSVFNEGGRSIVGGLTKNQLERQLRGSLGTVDPDDAATGPIAKRLSSIECPNKSRSIQSYLSDAEREKRRKAAAGAAERRCKEP